MDAKIDNIPNIKNTREYYEEKVIKGEFVIVIEANKNAGSKIDTKEYFTKQIVYCCKY